MPEITWKVLPQAGGRSVAGLLGSFDPPHRGHAFILKTLLERFDRVMLLIPTRHFQKQVRPPFNATFDQRFEMLRVFTAHAPGKVGLALAHEVLYLRLATALCQQFATTQIGFGMGDESFAKLLRTREYVERMGQGWSELDETALRAFIPNVVVFGRSCATSQSCVVPERFRTISSTAVRDRVSRLRDEAIPLASWADRLRDSVSSDVVELIQAFGLYPAIHGAVPSPGG